ncbi:hypothetical protein [Nonomuraea sp. NPDC050643]|uniref:hypothetical protein n=1 Tax=Nonomuraea sp. NPDC050643 TaxID=3155660 RepID=UPI0034006444
MRFSQEVADAVAALGGLLLEPPVEILLEDVREVGCLAVDPGQQVQGDQDATAQFPPDGSGGGALTSRARGPAMHGVPGIRVGDVIEVPTAAAVVRAAKLVKEPTQTEGRRGVAWGTT